MSTDVPCLIQYSPHGGITPTILTNCLRRMDELNLFPRVDNKKPFLLLDGHDSRFDLQFLSYIRDPNHPWSACIGLPYGTHLWQVGDSNAQNGNYKHFEQLFKDILLNEKRLRHLTLNLTPTDVVPIVNYAWERSFAVRKNNTKAILERGWFPTNRALQVNKDVLRTKKISNESNLTVTEGTYQSVSGTGPVLNTSNGAAGTILDLAINNNKNDPVAMKRKKDRLDLARVTRDVQEKTKKLTSGSAFFNDDVALNSDSIWEHQNKWFTEKEAKVQEKQNAAKKLFFDRKEKCDNIRKRPNASWTINDISYLLTYKRQKNDPVIKKSKANRVQMMMEWEKRSHRPTPPCSPILVVEVLPTNNSTESYEI
jgi:hypothetical protein